MTKRQQPSTAVLFMTHAFDKQALRAFRHLAETCPPYCRPMALINGVRPAEPPPLLAGVPCAYVSTPDARDPAYGAKALGGPNGWHISRDGHTDLLLLRFAREHPEFDQFWSIEYDVRFTGSWGTLFDAFREGPAAFLATTIRAAPEDPGWAYWPTLRAPVPLADSERTACFMPIFRASRAAVEAMDRAYRDGWSGHLEVTWPTALRRAGLAIEDIGGDGAFVAPENRNRFYTNSPTWNLAPGSLVFKPARFLAGRKPDTLWHPIKPAKVTGQEYVQRIKAKLHAHADPIWNTCVSVARGAVGPR